MAEPKVHFVEQTQAEYDASLAHSASTIYFCTDTKKIYKGDDEYCASSGGNDFVVTYTESDGTYTATHDGEPVTFAEITAAIEAGKNVKAKWNDGQADYIMPLARFYSGGIAFSLIYETSSLKISHDEVEEITFSQIALAEETT